MDGHLFLIIVVYFYFSNEVSLSILVFADKI